MSGRLELRPRLDDREDVIWLAGIAEGEACIDLHRGRYPRFRVGMTDRDVVGRVATLIGSRVRLSLRPAPHAAMFHAEVSGAKAEEVIRALLPFLGARRSAKAATVLGHATLGTRGSAPGPKITRPPAMPLPAPVAPENPWAAPAS